MSKMFDLSSKNTPQSWWALQGHVSSYKSHPYFWHQKLVQKSATYTRGFTASKDKETSQTLGIACNKISKNTTQFFFFYTKMYGHIAAFCKEKQQNTKLFSVQQPQNKKILWKPLLSDDDHPKNPWQIVSFSGQRETEKHVQKSLSAI